jgi:cytochrome c oxidase subunit 2
LAPRKLLLVATTCALAVLAFGAAPAHAIQLSPADPHSPNAEDINTTYWVMLAVSVAFILVVNTALIVAIVRFRDRRDRRPARLAAGRGALRPAIGALSLIAIAVFVFGVVMTGEVRDVEPSGPGGLSASPTAQVGVKGVPPLTEVQSQTPPSGEESVTGTDASESAPLEINAIGQQWLWRFEYPGSTPTDPTFSYGELVVPVDTTVLLSIDSTDVMHSWWIPALGGQVQAAPGDLTQTWFKADAEGVYPGRSTIFSGSSYPAMRAWVRVVSVPEYQDYVQQLHEDLLAAQDTVQREVSQQ